MVRKHFTITGNVQGVGFRYRASHAANGMGITGWVKNEWDGSVVMEAQGQPELINRMLVMINRSEYIVIDRMLTKEIPLVDNETGFHIR